MDIHKLYDTLNFSPDTDMDVNMYANECFIAEFEMEIATESVDETVSKYAAKFMNFVRSITQKMIQWASSAARTISVVIMKVRKKKAMKKLDKAKPEVKISSRLARIIENSEKLDKMVKELDVTSIDSLMAMIDSTSLDDSENFDKFKDAMEEFSEKIDSMIEPSNGMQTGKENIESKTIATALTVSFSIAKSVNKTAQRLDKAAVKLCKSWKKDGGGDWEDKPKLGNIRWAINKSASLIMRAAKAVFNAAITATNHMEKIKAEDSIDDNTESSAPGDKNATPNPKAYKPNRDVLLDTEDDENDEFYLGESFIFNFIADHLDPSF